MLTFYRIIMIKSHLVIKIIKWYAVETIHGNQNICLTNDKDKQDLFDKYKISWLLSGLDF